MVTLEALAYELPVLGSNAGGTPNLLGQGQFGNLFESMNAEDLALKIDAMLEKPLILHKDSLNKHLLKFDHLSVCEKLETILKMTHEKRTF